MATSPATTHSSGFLTPIKSRLANRLSGTFLKRSYNQFETSSSVDDFGLNSSKSEDPEFSGFSPTEIKSFAPSTVHNDYMFTKDNYVLFYIQFTRVEYGLFKDLINLNTPVQDVINRYTKFFHDSPKLKLFSGPKIGVSQKVKFGRSRSLGLGKISGTYHKLEANSSLSEQNINSSYLLVISPSSEAKFNKEMFQAYLDSKTEETLFVERWLPAVQGTIPLSEDAACVVAASLYTLNSMQNSATGHNSSPRDFIHRAVPVSKLAETKIARTLEEIKQDSVGSIMKLCADTILSNFLSGAIIFSVSTSGSTSHKKDAYLVISSDSVGLVKKSDLSRITPNIRIKDIQTWTPTNSILDIYYINRNNPSVTLQFQIRSNDTHLISSTMTAVAHAYVSNK